MIEYIEKYRTKSDRQVEEADWNSSASGYGVDGVSIDELAMYAMKGMYVKNLFSFDKLSVSRKAQVEKRIKYWTERIVNEVSKEKPDYYTPHHGDDEPYYEMIGTYGISEIEDHHQARCVEYTMKRIFDERELITPLLAELRKQSQNKRKYGSMAPTPDALFQSYADELVICLLKRMRSKDKAKRIATKTMKLAKKILAIPSLETLPKG